MAKVGFLGLGVMGRPMAAHLAREHEVLAWNRTPGKTVEGARVVSDPEEIASRGGVIFLCVSRSEDVAEVMGRLRPAAPHGTLFVDHSTIAPEAARREAEACRAVGQDFVDAPVTGGSVGAQNGTLTVFCGGDEEPVARAVAIMAPYTRRAERVGPSGAGQTMKLANQIAVAGALQALCESLAFARKAGLDLSQARAMIGGGSGGSWAFENYGPKILAKDWTPGFSVTNQRKDLDYVVATAEAIGATVPGTVLVNELLGRLAAAGRGEETTAALFDVLAS